MTPTPVLSAPPLRSPFLDPNSNKISWPWLKWLTEVVNAINGGVPISSFPGLNGDVVAAPGSITTTVEKIQGITVESGTPGDGQVLEYNASLTEWIFATLPGALNVITKNANYAASAGDIVLCDTTSGGFMVTLPNAGAAKNKTISVKKVSGDGNNVSVVSTSLIDNGGAAVFSIPFTALTFVSDGAKWWVV